jgi:FkbM family methyltransferase
MEARMKTVRIGQNNISIIGASDTDQYFDIIGNGSGDDFDVLLSTLDVDRAGIALDIGANIGITAAILSQRFSKVFAFEPGPGVFAALKANVETNDLSNVTPINAAVSNIPGTVRFAENSAYGHISSEGVAVTAVTVDDFADLNSLHRVDLMKIDVEGFEKDVLIGAEKTIARFDPIVHMEFNSWTLVAHSRQNPLEFAEWLFDKFGFIYLIDGTTIVRMTSAIDLASRNMIKSAGCVNDLILCNKEVKQRDVERKTGTTRRARAMADRARHVLAKVRRSMIDVTRRSF